MVLRCWEPDGIPRRSEWLFQYGIFTSQMKVMHVTKRTCTISSPVPILIKLEHVCAWLARLGAGIFGSCISPRKCILILTSMQTMSVPHFDSNLILDRHAPSLCHALTFAQVFQYTQNMTTAIFAAMAFAPALNCVRPFGGSRSTSAFVRRDREGVSVAVFVECLREASVNCFDCRNCSNMHFREISHYFWAFLQYSIETIGRIIRQIPRVPGPRWSHVGFVPLCFTSQKSRSDPKGLPGWPSSLLASFPTLSSRGLAKQTFGVSPTQGRSVNHCLPPHNPQRDSWGKIAPMRPHAAIPCILSEGKG